ncbi:branched-chain amino acid ABC transporter permease, partial [Campylobacter jejuni]|nr:branched-chain amino acid ABC transporter permease [Campylobacter jejuni]
MIFAACVGIATDRIAYKHLRQAPRISLLITAIGNSFFLQNLFNMLFTSTLCTFTPPSYFEERVNFGGVITSYGSLMVPALTFVI